MWFEVIKTRQPSSAFDLAFKIQDNKQTDMLVRELETAKVNENFKGLLSRIKAGKLTFDSILAKLPVPDFPREQAEKNLERIMQTAKFETISNLEPVLREAIALNSKIRNPNEETTTADEEKLASLVERIVETSKKNPSKLRKNKVIRELLDYFNKNVRPKKNFVLTFENIPDDKAEFEKKLQEVAEIIVKEEKVGEETVTTYLGKVENGEILTNFATANELLAFLNSDADKKGIFVEALAPFSPKLPQLTRSLGAKKKKTSRKKQSEEKLQDLIVRGVKFTPATIDSYEDVQKYLKALTSVPYSLKAFVPDVLSTTTGDNLTGETNDMPEQLILSRESGRSKSIILNPYADLLMKNDYTNPKTWFRDFFEDIRISQIVKEGAAEVIVLDDIYDMIQLNKTSRFGFNPDMFSSISLSENRKASRQKLKDIIRADSTLNAEFNRGVKPMLENVLTELRTDFTVNEAEQLLELWNSEDADFEEEYGELSFVYKDSKGQVVDSEGDAKFVEVQINGESKNSNEIKEILDDEGEEIEMMPFRELVGGNNFISYVLSLEDLGSILTEANTSAKYIDKLEPKNSLVFLATISESMTGQNEDLVINALEEISLEESDSEKELLLQELNDKMPQFLKDLKEQLINAFQIKLNDFSENYINYVGNSKDKAIRAIEAFKREGLLEE